MCISVVGILVASLIPSVYDSAMEDAVHINSAAVYDDSLLCLYTNGSIVAWDLKSGRYAKDTSARFARDKLQAIAAHGSKLWAVDGKTVFLWSAMNLKWEKYATFDAGEEWPVAITPIGDKPYIVFPSKLIDPTREKDGVFKVPAGKAPWDKPPLRILATHYTDSMVWIGTGYGEWGGTLLGFDPMTGKWVVLHRGGGYATGITHSAKDEVTVSWSMSHFRADTQIITHKADATVKTEYPLLGQKYYQCITYSKQDDLLYGIEQSDIVTIKDGNPTKVATLAERLYEREPKAIGVAPGIASLISAGPKTLIVIPKQGLPWLMRGKEVTRLRTP
jgi:hypothetical protein